MMKYTKLVALLLVIMMAFGVAGCSSDDDDTTAGPSSTNYFDQIAETGFQYFNTYETVNVPASAVYDNMLNNVDMFIIDWRGADAYAAGHIEGAVNWSSSELTSHVSELPTDMPIINVCYTGQTASQMTSAMRLMGYDNAQNMLFGMCGWVADGAWANLQSYGYDLETTANTMSETFAYPEASSDVATADAAIQDRIAAYLAGGTKNIDAQDVYNRLNDNDASNDPFVINYWGETDYDLGHIPGAYQLSPKSWDMDVLSKIPADRDVVIYCYTGQTSSQVTMFLRVLGYQAYSLKFGMNAINNTHPSNHGYTAPESDYPVVTN